MKYLLELLLYRHRTFKGETYLRNHFPLMFVVSLVVAIVLADSYSDFFIVVAALLLIDVILAISAWLYYRNDL